MRHEATDPASACFFRKERNHVDGPTTAAYARNRISQRGRKAHGGDRDPLAGHDRHHPGARTIISPDQPNVYVCGNLLLYYEEGNPRKHVSPDVLVALNVPKKPLRDHYLVWKEGKAPDFIVEITSKSTKQKDKKKKLAIYRDILRVSEYFLFDPTEDYLKPPLQGFRLIGGQYVGIEPVAGRLPSQVLGLHLERDGKQLRLFDPATGRRLLTRLEAREEAERARRGTPPRRRRAPPRRRPRRVR